MDKGQRPNYSTELIARTIFTPTTEAEEIMLDVLNRINDMSDRRKKLWGADFYGNLAKQAFSKLNKLK